MRLEQLTRAAPPLTPETTVAAAGGRFSEYPGTTLLAVVFGDSVVGAVCHTRVLEALAREGVEGAEVGAPVTRIMDAAPVIVDARASVSALLGRARGDMVDRLHDGVITTLGRAYHGVVPGPKLVSAMSWLSRSALLRESRSEEETSALRAALAAEVKSQSTFLSALGHELRTPLTAILANADWLHEEAASAKAEAHARAIAAGCQDLDELIGHLLAEMDGFSASAASNEPASVGLDVLAADLGRLWSARAEAKGLGWSVQPPRAQRERVEIDRTGLMRILNALVANALAYTDTGQVEVGFETPRCSDTPYLNVTVRDSGPGLDEAARAHLFEPFSRPGPGGAAPYTGSGLGLYLARSQARRMGGTLTCESSPGTGTCFCLSVPFRPATPKRAPQKPRAGIRGSGIRNFSLGAVLLVEDHEPTRVALGDMLRGAGWRVDAVMSVAQAVRRARERAYQAILSDVVLPDGSAADLAEALKAGAMPGPSVPILAVTADTRADRHGALLACGIAQVIEKPVRTAALVAALADTILDAGTAEESLSQPMAKGA